MSRKFWSLQEDFMMINNYATSSIPELMKLLPDRTPSQIYNRSYALNLKKDPQYLKQMSRELILKVGQDTRFTKGTTPYNKGQKGLKPYHHAATFFPKGNVPHNHRPLGSERISKDGYLQIKVAEPNKWLGKHRHVWEQYHKAPIPKGHIVIFKDGNKRNFEIENLRCITMKENRLMNSGSFKLTDDFVAMCICGKNDKEHREAIMEDKAILELKRQQLKLQRVLKSKNNDNKGN